MTAKMLAKLIPADYRKEILQTNIIMNAMAHSGDSSMLYLGTIWKNYVVPEEDLSCGICLERILKNFRELQPILIELEKESNLLESL